MSHEQVSRDSRKQAAMSSDPRAAERRKRKGRPRRAEAGNEAYTTLLHTRQIWFVPVVNPDSYEYNRQRHPNGRGMGRKNRHPGCGSGDDTGVDLNRNYPYGFGEKGSNGQASRAASCLRRTTPRLPKRGAAAEPRH